MSLEKILKEIQSEDNLREAHSQIKEMAQRSETESLIKLAKLLVENWDSSPQEEWRYRSGFGQILDALALNQGEENLRAIFEILLASPARTGRLGVNQTAIKITNGQSAEIADKVLADLDENLFELAAILVYELVFRAAGVSRYPNLVAIAEKMKSVNHPLSRLPLYLLNYENQLSQFLRRYSIGGSSHSSPFSPNSQLLEIRDSPYSLDGIQELALQNNLIEAAVDNWRNASNGKIESRQFSLPASIDASSIANSRLLLDLKLDCLKNAKVSELILKRVSPNDVLNTLFSAAATGGAYNQGLGHAYGRLKIWESVAGLMGFGATTEITHLHDAMGECVWFSFETVNDNWFYHVAWDAGILCLSADGKLLSVLAASDTD